VALHPHQGQGVISGPRDEALTIISHLAEIGPRRAGSPQEATAAAFINGRLRRSGMGVTTHSLPVTPRRRRLYAVTAACGLFAALSAIILPTPALSLALVAIVALLVDSATGPLVSFGPHYASQTIVGTQAIAGGAGLAARVPRWRVVLLAPLDTPSAIGGLASLAGPGHSAAMARLVALGLVALAALAEQLSTQRGWVLLAVPAAVLLAVQLAAALRGPEPAALDGGVGALAALALAAQQLHELEHVEVWAAAIGAAAMDAGGVEGLLRIYPFERERTLIIALERIDCGRLHYSLGRGDAGLRALVAEAAAAAGGDVGEGPRTAGALSEPLARRGMRVISLASGTEPGAGGGRQADPRIGEVATRLVVALVERLERAR
jgi:hypothetical protein